MGERAEKTEGCRAAVIGADVAWEAFGAALNDGGSMAFFRSVEDAVRGLKDAQIDLLVVKLPLERMDPVGALQRLRADVVTSELPVLVLSPRADDTLAAKCLSLEAEFASTEMGPAEFAARVERSLRAGQRQQALARRAETDALTGLANFGSLRDRLDHEYKRASRYDYPLSAVMIDLDHLKRINDQHGHAVGNRAIAGLAEHLRNTTRGTDFAARFGGDEFVLLLPYQTPSEAAVLLERIRMGLQSVKVEGHGGAPVQLTLSAGVAGHSSRHPARDAAELMLAADEALYQAKSRGRDQIVVHPLLGLSAA